MVRASRILAASVVCLLFVVVAPAAARSASPAARYTIVELPTPAGDTSAANAVNNAGTVVGAVTTANGLARATKWSASGARTDLGVLPGGSSSVANGVNDAGQVAGAADRTSGGFAYPVRWNAAGAIQDLGGPLANRLGSAS